MKKKYILVAHYTDSTATILDFERFPRANYEFQACKLHPDLAFAILYSLSDADTTYRVLGSFVPRGFAKPKTPAGQD